MRRLLIVVAAVALLGACTWVQPQHDAGNSNSNDLDRIITPANVDELVEHRFTVPPNFAVPGLIEQVTVSNTQIWTLRGATVVRAFDADTCPRTDDGDCPTAVLRTDASAGAVVSPQYSGILGDDERTFVPTTTGLKALDRDGNVLFSVPAVGPGRALSNGFLYYDVWRYIGSKFAVDLYRLPATGCGASTCTGTLLTEWFIPAPLAPQKLWLVHGDTVVAASPYVTAYDGASGAVRWTLGGSGRPLAARDGRLLVPWNGGFGVFETDPGSRCTMDTAICEPVGYYSWANGYVAATPTSLIATDVNGTLRWYPPLTACSTSPCDAFATTGGPAGGLAAVAGSLLYVASDGRLDVYDASGIQGCAGGTCAPLATRTFTGSVSTAPVVANGRVYLATADGVVHVFGLSFR